ncbi:hypothetical protein GCK72_014216 [Caenorhabditis remanei]|uniref:Uncharacterized protein n=1 Tax=Caenorhabditis remanei TaxID=31234 RepID=A0A6A5GQU3_CAERE|nr:hypothetical protein GCK72_014216 [Caenorhabditis remanei]KAF1757760.1 hypothetical protein GCK72_014216 [Caenorhabditis remanei]
MNWITVALALAVVDLSFCGNNIHPHFMAWMKQNYKPEEVAAFVRDELTTGSFGGGVLTQETTDRPVILVHGLNNEAGSFWKIARDFAAAGHPTQYLFATTWGRGVEQTNLNVAMSCGHVRHIRRFIEAVLKYTGAPQVDIIGYSMGSPIARKAIMGGKCVDENVELGQSIQSRVHTYISVAGANQGSQLCMFPFLEICNMNTGLACNSKFLNDINWFKNYESTYKSFNLASTGDFVVGYMACGKKASEFAGGHEYKVEGMNHEQTEFDTAAIQLKMLRESTSGQSKSRPSVKEDKKKNAFADVKKYLNSKRRDVRHTEPKKPKSPKRSPQKKSAPKKVIQKRAPAKKASPPKRAAPSKKNQQRDTKKDQKKPAKH